MRKLMMTSASIAVFIGVAACASTPEPEPVVVEEPEPEIVVVEEPEVVEQEVLPPVPTGPVEGSMEDFQLGERRAAVVKNYLVDLGVDPARIQTVSYGKERPIALGSNEDAWAQNRNGFTQLISGVVG